jgi:hypothetical protein
VKHERKPSDQCQRVLEYIQQGKTVTNMVALTCLGVGSLTSRIAELRRIGHKIDSEWAEDRFGRRYKEYRYRGVTSKGGK